MGSVSVRDVAVGFGSVNIFENLSMDIAKGEFIVLLGPSGCGKSTLLNAIAGSPGHQGRADLDRRPQRHLGRAQGPRHRHGVPVLLALPAHERRDEHVLRAPDREGPQGRDQSAASPRPRSSCNSIRCCRASPPNSPAASASASPSAARWCATSTCSCSTSRLSNLDAKLRNELRVEIKKLHQEIGNTMIYVTHDQVEALTLADRIAVMKGGVIQQFASPHEIYHRPANLFVAGFIGSPAMNTVEGDARTTRRRRGGSTRRVCRSTCRAIRSPARPRPRNATLGVRPEHIGVGRRRPATVTRRKAR